MEWSTRFGIPGTDTPDTLALQAFDDGTEPALYVGGHLKIAGNQVVRAVARWDGTSWAPVGMSDYLAYCFAVFDDGAGPALYRGGDYWGTAVQRWTGAEWEPVGPYPNGVVGKVYALAVYDDGAGPALYAAGRFTVAGGVTCNRIARWDGSAWQPLGSGMNSTVWALTTYNGELVAGGSFTVAGGVTCNRIARWDGATWSALDSGTVPSSVGALVVFDDGTGPALYAGGDFEYAGDVPANGVARWDGTQWTALGSGVDAPVSVSSLAVYDDGTGPALFVGGSFTTAGGVAAQRLAKWAGQQWSAVGSGMDATVKALAVWDDGAGPALFAAGGFERAGETAAQHVARYDAQGFSALGDGQGLNYDAVGLGAFDDGAGPAWYVTGGFSAAGTTYTRAVARWTQAGWSPVAGFDESALVASAVPIEDAGGSALYFTGWFETAGGVLANNIARWDGANWAALGSGLSGLSIDAYWFDDGSGPALFVGGEFDTAGGVPASSIARWDGFSWSEVGGGLYVDPPYTYPHVNDLEVFDDGHGPRLYATGWFSQAGSAPAANIARWDGTQWAALGSGLTSTEYSAYGVRLVVFDDGSGPALYVGGYFTHADGVPASGIARWDGTSFSAVGESLGDVTILGLTAFDDGSGPALYAAGYTSRVAKWDGQSWTLLPGAFDGTIYALGSFDDGSGPALWCVGDFLSVDGKASARIARWGCVPNGLYGDLNCDGTVDLGDVNPFVQYLSNFAAWQAAYPLCHALNGDINADGTYGQWSFGDINPFIELLIGGR
jgi:hypothetical protein